MKASQQNFEPPVVESALFGPSPTGNYWEQLLIKKSVNHFDTSIACQNAQI